MAEAKKYVKRDYVDGVLYMLRDPITVHQKDQIDEFPAGEVYLYDGKNFVSTRDGTKLGKGIIRKTKNDMIPASEWKKLGLKWHDPRLKGEQS